MFRPRGSRRTGRRGRWPELSIWDPVHLGVDERGRPVLVSLAGRHLIAAGEPGAGKSVALNLIVAHAALSLDCRLILIDGKQVELGLWRACAQAFIGPNIAQAIELLRHLQTTMDTRYEVLLETGRRQITRTGGVPVVLVVFDELAYFSATVGEAKQQREFVGLVRDLVARGRAAGIIPPACGTCSGTGGRSAAPPTPAPMSSSATAGPTRDIRPPTSTRPAAAWAG